MSDAKPKPRIRLHPAAMLLVGVAAISLILVGVLASAGAARDWMVLAVSGLLMVLVAIVLAGLGYLVSKRSTLVFNVVLGVVFGLFATFNGWTIVKRREAASQQKATAPAMKPQAPSKAAQPTPTTAATGTTAPTNSEVAASAPRQLSREQIRAAVTDVAGPLSKELGARATKFVEKKKQFEDAGSVDPRTITDLEDVARRVELLAQLRKANDEFGAILAEAPARIRQQLTERGLRPALVDAAVEGFTERQKLEPYTQITIARVKGFEAMDRYFALLSKHWDSRTIEDGRFTFVDEDANKVMQQVIDEILAASKDEAAVGAQGSRRKPPAGAEGTPPSQPPIVDNE